MSWSQTQVSKLRVCERESFLQDSHWKGKMMINSGNFRSATAEEEKQEKVKEGGWEDGKRTEINIDYEVGSANSTVKVENRHGHECSAEDFS